MMKQIAMAVGAAALLVGMAVSASDNYGTIKVVRVIPAEPLARVVLLDGFPATDCLHDGWYNMTFDAAVAPEVVARAFAYLEEVAASAVPVMVYGTGVCSASAVDGVTDTEGVSLLDVAL